MIITAKNSSNFTPVPAGMWLARCYRVIDLGTQKFEYQGSVDRTSKIMIQWEVYGEDEHGNSLTTSRDEPLSISKTYTKNLAENTTLRKDLVSWRGRDFTREELMGFDPKNILGAWCMVSVVTAQGNNGREYSNVNTVNPVPAPMKKNLPEGRNKLQIFDFDDPDMEVFESLSKNIKSRIESSPEWNAIKGKSALKDTFADLDEEIPF